MLRREPMRFLLFQLVASLLTLSPLDARALNERERDFTAELSLASGGDAGAQRRVAREIWLGACNRGRGDIAMQWLESAAAYGDIDARVEIAGMTVGTPNADEKAILEVLESAADKGSGNAALMLSRLYRVGQYVGEDLPRADILLRRAASTGYAEAQRELGQIVLANDPHAHRAEAISWLRLAAAQGDMGAMFSLARVEGITRTEFVVWETLRLAADSSGMDKLALVRATEKLSPSERDEVCAEVRELSSGTHPELYLRSDILPGVFSQCIVAQEISYPVECISDGLIHGPGQ